MHPVTLLINEEGIISDVFNHSSKEERTEFLASCRSNDEASTKESQGALTIKDY